MVSLFADTKSQQQHAAVEDPYPIRTLVSISQKCWFL